MLETRAQGIREAKGLKRWLDGLLATARKEVATRQDTATLLRAQARWGNRQTKEERAEWEFLHEAANAAERDHLAARAYVERLNETIRLAEERIKRRQKSPDFRQLRLPIRVKS